MMKKGENDLQKDDKGKAQPVTKIEEKPEGSKSKESEAEKGKSVEKEKADEAEKVKRIPQTVASVWELLMNSKFHREALVLALDHKKLFLAHLNRWLVR